MAPVYNTIALAVTIGLVHQLHYVSANDVTSGSPSVALVVATTFNGEPVMATHLRVVYDHVDLIFVTEARVTHTGSPKSVLYIEANASMFEPYLAKVRFVVIDEFPPRPVDFPYMSCSPAEDEKCCPECWWRENYQREAFQQDLLRVYPEAPFLVFVVDADEIIYPNLLKDFRRPSSFDDVDGFGLVHLSLDLFYYDIRW